MMRPSSFLFVYSPTPIFFFLFSFHLLTMRLPQEMVTDSNLSTLPHILPFSYRARNVGSVRSTIRDSFLTMGSTPWHMVTRISQGRWTASGRVHYCLSCQRMRPLASDCIRLTRSIPQWFNHAQLRSRCGRLEARPHSRKERNYSWMA